MGVEEKFVGAWRLVSFEPKQAAKVEFPYWKNPKGFIMYTKEGYMMVAIMNTSRPKFTSADRWGAGQGEKAFAFDSYQSYAGRYEVKGDKVIHHTELAVYPNWIGGVQERVFKFTGNRLELDAEVGHLIWERI